MRSPKQDTQNESRKQCKKGNLDKVKNFHSFIIDLIGSSMHEKEDSVLDVHSANERQARARVNT